MNDRTQAMQKNVQLLKSAMNNLGNEVKKAKVAGGRILCVEELKCTGNQNSDVITLEVSNANAVTTYNLVFGTPVGLADEYLNIPFNTTISDIMFTGLADLSDQQGVGINFLQEINKRLVRHAIYVSNIEVITPNTPLGSDQRSIAPRKFIVPYNSFSDSQAVVGSFVPQWTEYTAINILEGGYVLGEFNGFSYELLPLSSIKLNIRIAAIDSPTFMYKHCK